MRRLLLLRHAKAERSQPGGHDRDRILAERGRADAAKIGAFLVRHRLTPDRALVSPAARTRETWELARAAFKKTVPVDFEPSLYEAEPDAILATIQTADPSAHTLLVIGHNPGLQQLAATLIATGDVETRQRLLEDYPTSALAAMTFASDGWDGVHPHGGRLEHFVTPKWLEAPTA